MIVQVGQALRFGDVGVIDAVPPFRHLPFAYPILRVGHREFDLQDSAVIDQAYALEDTKLIAGRNARSSLIHPVMMVHEMSGVDHERIAFPSADGFSIEASHDDI